MDRLIAPNSVPFASADTAPASGTAQYATSGNPATGTPATVLPAYAWNMIQDEIYNVIIAAGLTPNRNAWNQLLTAIQTMLQGSTTNVGADTGAANAYVVAFTPALTAPVPWVPFWFEVAHTNTGASTLNATGTVEPLVGGAHLALQGNELVANGNALVYWNPTLASGAGSYVLLLCSGAAEQIAPATAPLHAMQLGQATGRVLNVRAITASTTYVPTPGTNSIDVLVIGGGGAGGSTSTTAAGQISVASGGSAGGACRSYLTTGFSGQAITIGAGGTVAGGGTGGASSFGSLLTAGPGATGANGVAAAAPSLTTPLGGGSATGGNVFNAIGQAGFPAQGINSSSFLSGAGGSSILGAGGAGKPTTSAPGNNAVTPGSGGGGALAGASTAVQTGGSGAAGIVIITEYS